MVVDIWLTAFLFLHLCCMHSDRCLDLWRPNDCTTRAKTFTVLSFDLLCIVCDLICILYPFFAVST